MKIRQKIITGYLGMLILFLITGSVSLVNMQKIQRSYAGLIDQRVYLAAATRDFLIAFEYEALMMRTYFLTGREEWAVEYRDQAKKADQILADIERSLSTGEERLLFERLANSVTNYNAAYAEPMMAVRGRSDLSEQQKLDEIVRLTLEQKGSVRGIIRLGDDFVNYQQRLLDEAVATNDAWVRQTRAATAGLGAVAVLLGLAAALYISRVIADPLKRLEQEAILIAGGDLTPRGLEARSRDEVGNLIRSFGAMVEKLRTLAERMRHSANLIATYTREMQSSTQNAAVAANATAAKMSQLSETTRKMNESAGKVIGASDRAAASLTRAEEASARFLKQMETGCAVVSRAGQAVRELEAKLTDAGEIIQFISMIADQASMLAKKAVTEVAYAAGEGSTFSDLAAEIQKRAQEAAAATRSITSVIENVQANAKQAVSSLEEDQEVVSGGYSVARETAAALKLLVSDLQSLTAQVKEVADLTRQVSEGVRVVTISSEEQTALVEGFAAATGTLSHVAGELQSTVAALKL
ncbi:MAG: methyl-accepting chemotaxis protein [Firmicutes bacterium]|nr:methyl-accepting chemotaxis protein [Bacillota bacterium]